MDQIKDQFQKLEAVRTHGLRKKSKDARQHLNEMEGQFVTQNHFVQNQGGSFENESESCSLQEKVSVNLPKNENTRNIDEMALFAMSNSLQNNGKKTPLG